MMTVRDVVQRSPDILNGTPVFRGTRVPVQTMFDYLEADQPLSEFLDDFPTVSPKQASEVLSLAREVLLADAHLAR